MASAILKVSYRYSLCLEKYLWPTYIQHGSHFLFPMGTWAPTFQKLGRPLCVYLLAFCYIIYCS
mgnify:CR=1 FL=1